MISELFLLCLATCLSCIFAFSPLTAKKIKVKNTVLHTDLCNMKTQMFLRMCWALEHLSGLMNLGCGLWGDTYMKNAQQRSVASMCYFRILHICQKNSAVFIRDSILTWSNTVKGAGSKTILKFTDKELRFLPPKLISKEVPCCKWHYKERQR